MEGGGRECPIGPAGFLTKTVRASLTHLLTETVEWSPGGGLGCMFSNNTQRRPKYL